MSADHAVKVLILGTGPAGYTAAIYAARANLDPLIVEGLQPGGQMTITTEVENYPGFPDPVQGPWLMEQMRAQAENVGARIVADTIVEADLTRRPFVCRGDSGDLYRAEALIVATGAQARWLGLPHEDTFKGFGLSACATCDGFFFRGKEVIVVGGGNTAVTEALYLANIAKRVTLIHRRGELRAEKVLAERLLAHPKIEVLWNHVVTAYRGESAPARLRGVTLASRSSGESVERDADGVFIAIGHTPNTALFEGQLERDPAGYLLTRPGTTATNIAGVFAAGDVQDPVYRQAVTAAGTGCMSALEAERFLAEAEPLPQRRPTAAE